MTWISDESKSFNPSQLIRNHVAIYLHSCFSSYSSPSLSSLEDDLDTVSESEQTPETYISSEEDGGDEEEEKQEG